MIGTELQSRTIAFVEIALFFRRNSRNKRSGTNDHLLRDNRARRDENLIGDRRAGENHRAHPDEYPAAERRPVHDRTVANRDIIANRTRRIGIDVNNRAILDIRSLADPHTIAVGADDDIEPNAAAGTNLDVADDHRTWRNKYIIRDYRRFALEGVNTRSESG